MFEYSKEELQIPIEYRVEFVARYSKKHYQYENAWFKLPFVFDSRNIKGLDVYKKMIRFLYGAAYLKSKKY